MGEVMRDVYDSLPKVVNTPAFGRNDRFVARNSADRAPGFGREEPDDPLLSRHAIGVHVLHALAFLAAQGGLLNAPPDGRRGRPLTPSSQKSSAGIGHSRVADGWIKRQRQLSAGPSWRSDSGDTRDPFFLNVNMLKEARSTAIGFPFISASVILALRTHWPAKRVRQWRVGNCSMRSRVALGRRYRVPSESSRK